MTSVAIIILPAVVLDIRLMITGMIVAIMIVPSPVIVRIIV